MALVARRRGKRAPPSLQQIADGNAEWAARFAPAARQADETYLTLEAWLVSQGHSYASVQAIPSAHKLVLMSLWRDCLIGPPLEAHKKLLAVNLQVDTKGQKKLRDFLPARYYPWDA